MNSKELENILPRYAVSQKYAPGILGLSSDTIIVEWSDGSVQYYDAVKLGCEWFKMSNDAFYEKYGFNFNPHKIQGLYEKCRRTVYLNEQ